MVRRFCVRPMWLVTLAIFAALAVVQPAAAQSTGVIKGMVVDEKNAPIEGARVVMEMEPGGGRKFETKTNKKGEYLQVGLASGAWKVTAEKDKLGSSPQTVTVRAAQTMEVKLMLAVATAAAAKEVQQKNQALNKAFEDAVALSGAGKHDEAIAKFQEAITLLPNCLACYNNMAVSYAQKKDWANAETAYKKAMEIKPDDPNAYVGLAGIYFNTGKAADAKPLVEKAIQIDPTGPDQRYIYGMTLVGEDPAKAKAQFEEYVKLAPNAPNATIAKQLITELDKQIKK